MEPLLSKITVSWTGVVVISSGLADGIDDFSQRSSPLLGLGARHAVQFEEFALTQGGFGRGVVGTINPFP